MSQEGSPGLLNLRGFRIQKKPSFSHNGLLNTSSETDSPSSNTVRKRIIPIMDSDSDCDAAGNVENNVAPSGFNTLSVAEKELQVRYLMRKFPKTRSYLIYELLSKHDFTLEKAVDELSVREVSAPIADFETFKKTESVSNIATSSAVKPENTSSTIARNHQTNSVPVIKNIATNNRPIQIIQATSQKRRLDMHNYSKPIKSKKQRFDADSDDEGYTNYKDTRVYDSDEDSDVEISDYLTTDKKKVLEFMNEAPQNELQLMNSCSKKKAEAIIASRPFQGWADLVTKLQTNKNLSADLLNAAQRVLMTRNNVKQLMRKCSNISQQLQFAINKGVIVKNQPSILSSGLTLTSYQMVGLNWLAVLHNQGLNGILADEMGLGKTVQVIAFLGYLKQINAARNAHLVVVPSSTLENWQNEFCRWCPSLNVLLYYGSMEERREFRFQVAKGEHRDYDVILTTYTMVSSTPEERKMFRVTPMHYVIFDEAHMLKNMNTQRYETLVRIKAEHRILLTGTPLQNNLLELMSLLIFVMPNIFSEKAEDLKSLFQRNQKHKIDTDQDVPKFEKEQIEQAKRIMKPFVLRRLKRDVLQDLPKKTDLKLEVPMAPTQDEHYKELVKSFKEVNPDADTRYNGMSMMTDLRKLSNHPLLMRYHYQYEDLPSLAKKLAVDPDYKDTVEQYIIDDLACMSDFEIHKMTKEFPCLRKYALPDNLILTSGKFLFLDKKLAELKHEGHRVLIFSQYVIMLNVMENYLKLRKHSYLRLDGNTPVTIRQQLIDEYNENENIFIFLLSTKAGGLGINLTAADTVIIHDIDFNPYNDKQAEDRCHRMGQTKPVTIYRLISKGTIEEAMWDMTQDKLKLEKEITTEDYEETADLRSVVSLLSSALGLDENKATNLVSPRKKLSIN